MIQEFSNDDGRYLTWLERHVGGFVLNVRRNYSSEYLVLHSSKCSAIRDPNAKRTFDAFTGRGYRKICATSIRELAQWAQAHGRSDPPFSKICKRCRPEFSQ
jgi:hypothetical protein